MAETSFRKTLSDQIFKNKRLIYCSLFVAVLCFGFAVTHFSIGVDDPARIHYLYSNFSGNMIQQGRLMHVLLNDLTGGVDFIPFFNEFLGASLFWLSSLLFCGVFQFVSGNRFSTLSLTAFACAYISYPILTDKFVYSLDVIVTMLGYCTCAASLAYAFLFVCTRKLKYNALACALLIPAIASYESFLFLYICGVFAIFCIRYLQDKPSFRKFLTDGLLYAAVLLEAALLYYAVVFAVQKATGQFGVFSRPIIWQYILISGPHYIIRYFVEMFYYAFTDSNYLSYSIFGFFTLAGFVLALVLSCRRRTPMVLISYGLMYVFTLAISVITGELEPRTLQTYCLLVAFTLMLAVDLFAVRPWQKTLSAVLVVFLVFIQSADMNRWFYNDYKRFQKETFAVNHIAEDLMQGYDLSKPIVFVQDEGNPLLDQYHISRTEESKVQAIGRSSINWSIGTFGDLASPMLFELFSMNGYDFLVPPTEAEAALGYEKGLDLPRWPQEGYILELDSILIVRL